MLKRAGEDSASVSSICELHPGNISKALWRSALSARCKRPSLGGKFSLGFAAKADEEIPPAGSEQMNE
jgi:hypothetical protein